MADALEEEVSLLPGEWLHPSGSTVSLLLRLLLGFRKLPEKSDWLVLGWKFTGFHRYTGGAR